MKTKNEYKQFEGFFSLAEKLFGKNYRSIDDYFGVLINGNKIFLFDEYTRCLMTSWDITASSEIIDPDSFNFYTIIGKTKNNSYDFLKGKLKELCIKVVPNRIQNTDTYTISFEKEHILALNAYRKIANSCSCDWYINLQGNTFSCFTVDKNFSHKHNEVIETLQFSVGDSIPSDIRIEVQNGALKLYPPSSLSLFIPKDVQKRIFCMSMVQSKIQCEAFPFMYTYWLSNIEKV